MKTIISVFVMLSALFAGAVEPLLHFGEGFSTSTKGCEGSVEKLPDSSGNAGMLVWTANPPKYALWNGGSRKLKPIGQFQKAEFTLNVYALPNTGVKVLSLRFRDSGGEVFQLSQYRPFTNVEAERLSIKFVLDSAAKIQSWGGNNDKKIDWPLRFIGGVCNFYPDSKGGKLYIESLEYSIPEEL